MNLKVFIMIKRINETKALVKHVSSECRCEFGCRKRDSKQKWNNDKGMQRA